LLANDYAGEADLTLANVTDAIRDYMPSRDAEMLEYMELLAVFEASNRKMLPKKYRDITNDELMRRVSDLQLRVGHRR